VWSFQGRIIPTESQKEALLGVFWQQYLETSLSPQPSEIQLQTSNVQSINRTTERHMSLIRKSDVKNHLSTRTGDTAVPVRLATDNGPSGKPGDGIKDALASPGVSDADGLISSAPDAGKQKA
jgi:hypothetical protein